MEGDIMMKVLLIGIALASSCCIAQETKEASTNDTTAVVREWTAVSGAKIKAEFVSKKNGMIELKIADGKQKDKSVFIKESALSDNDKTYLVDKPDTGEATPAKKAVASKYPPEAKEFNGHHYMLYSDTSKWGSAKFKCTTRGGHLVVINNAEENKFVYQLIKEHRVVWIGLSKNIDSWRWVTVDGGEFTNWAPGQPSIKKGTATSKIGVEINVCMYGAWYDGHQYYYSDTRNGRWDDRFGDDSDVTGYVCEWDE
jgi:hypothetical protein